jgi:tetratricopeptide (TPR) repeat protein
MPMETTEFQKLHEEADRLYKDGQLQRALEVYEGIVATSPDDALAYGRIGAIMAQWEELDKAETALKRAIELDPSLATAHSNLGNVYYARGDYQLALQKYQEAISINPENPIFYQNLHAANKQLGRLADAVAALKRAHKLERQAVKEEAKAQFGAASQRLKRRVGCLPVAVLCVILLVIGGTATLL